MLRHSIILATILVFLTDEVLAQQCFSGSGCTGALVEAPGPSAIDCCSGTEDGQSYGSPGNCTISQCIVHGFEQLSYTTPESDILQGINFRPNVKGTGQLFNIEIISGIIDLEEDTAIPSDISDFPPVTVPLATNAALNIQVIPQYDTISLELDDRIILRFTPSNPAITPDAYFAGTGEFLRDFTVVHIMDDDSLTINFGSTDYDIGEEEGIITIEMTIREAQMPFTLTLTPTTVDDVLADTRFIATDYLTEAFSTLPEAGKATPGRTNDYDDTVIFRTILPSTTSRVVSQDIRITNDNINEIEQQFAVVGELGSEVPEEFVCFRVTVGEAECRGRVGTTGIRIRDNDPMILGFGERRRTVSENDATPGQEFFDLNIFINSLRTSEVAYPVGVRSIIRGEPIIEPSDDIVNPRFDGVFGQREENTINNLVTIDTLAVDTTMSRGLLVRIRDDFLAEEEECFELSIFPVNPQEMINFMCNTTGDEFLCQHEICIMDDDEPFRVAFDQTMYTVVESAGSVEVCVNLTHPRRNIRGQRVTVLVFHDDSSIYVPPNPTFATPDPPMGIIFISHNMIPGSDYEEETRSASTIRSTFIEEERRQICYDQVIYDDERLELTETAGLELVPDDLDTQVEVDPFYHDSVFFIIDDDEAVVGLERTIFTVFEDVGVVELCARVVEPAINCPIEFPFDVTLFTTDRTAVSPMDYIALSVTLTFDTCDTRRCVNVSIVEDIVNEPDEVFDYSLVPAPIGLDPRITIRPDMGAVLITDNDGPIVVGYEFTTYQTNETDSSVDLSIIVINPPSVGAPRPFSLSVSTRGISAVAPDDYEAVTSSVIQFNVGDIRVTHTIRINQDHICETDPNEAFFSDIVLNTGMQPINVTRETATITIDDSAEPECNPIRVGYNQTEYTIDEGQPQVQLCVIIYEPDSGGAPRPFSLLVSTSDSTAVSMDDYEPVTSEVLDFAVGQTAACHDVNIIDDNICENDPNESFFFNLVLGGGEQPIDVEPEQIQVIIDDTDEPECRPITVGYELMVHTTTESNYFVEFCAVITRPRSGIAPRDFTVSSTTRDGTAIQGVDYVAISDNLVFLHGDTYKCHRVEIIDDEICEPTSENFFADLLLVSGGDVFISPNVNQVLIAEERCDPIRVGYMQTLYITDEGQRQVQLCVIIYEPDSGGAPRPFSLLVSTSDSTAVSMDDYEPVSSDVLDFAAEQTMACHDVNIIDDNVCENGSNEIFFLDLVLGSGEQPIDVVPEQAIVTIDDTNERECGPITVRNELEVYTTLEGHVFVELCAVITQPPDGIAPRDFSVSSTTRDGTAIQGLDYVATSVNLEFLHGDSRKCHEVEIIDDEICEPTLESFFADMLLISGADVSVNPNLTQVHIVEECVEDFEGIVSSSTSFTFTWSAPNTGNIGYSLKCVPLLDGIPVPEADMLTPNVTSAVVTGLHSGVTYDCSITTITTRGRSEPISVNLTTPEIAPSGRPEMFERVAGQRQVIFSWSPPAVTQRNGVITSYTLSCSPSPSSLPLSPSQSGQLNVTGFSPNTPYSCSVVATNSQGSGPPETRNLTTQQDYTFFQLRLGGLPSTCKDLQSSERDVKLQDITTQVLEQLATSCPECSNGIIDRQSFACFPESPTHVTFRARLEGTSETDSVSLISLIEVWVRGGPSIGVAGVLMTVDPQCSVAISSLSEEECSTPPPPSTTDSTESPTNASTTDTGTNNPSSSDSTIAAITGGVMAVVIVIVVAIFVAIIAAMILKSRRGNLTLNKEAEEFELTGLPSRTVVEGGTIETSDNTAYGAKKQGGGEPEDECEGVETSDNAAYGAKKQGGGELDDEYELADTPPEGPPGTFDVGEYEVPTPPLLSRGPLPAVPSSAGDKEKEDGVYEFIPGDK